MSNTDDPDGPDGPDDPADPAHVAAAILDTLPDRPLVGEETDEVIDRFDVSYSYFTGLVTGDIEPHPGDPTVSFFMVLIDDTAYGFVLSPSHAGRDGRGEWQTLPPKHDVTPTEFLAYRGEMKNCLDDRFARPRPQSSGVSSVLDFLFGGLR